MKQKNWAMFEKNLLFQLISLLKISYTVILNHSQLMQSCLHEFRLMSYLKSHENCHEEKRRPSFPRFYNVHILLSLHINARQLQEPAHHCRFESQTLCLLVYLQKLNCHLMNFRCDSYRSSLTLIYNWPWNGSCAAACWRVTW